MLRIILIMPVAHFIGLVAVAQPAAQKSGDLKLDGRVLAGSRWAARVAEDCSDSLVFLSGHRVSEYSCEAGEWYSGSYVLRTDTVIVTRVTVSEDGGGKEFSRTGYLYQGNLLKPAFSQGYFHGKWENLKPAGTPGDYVFKKMGR